MRCDVDFYHKCMFYFEFKDLSEALSYVEKVRHVLNEIKGQFEIVGFSGKADLLSVLFVTFNWYFMDANPHYEISIEVDERVRNITRKLFRLLMEKIPADYRKISVKDIREILRLAGYG